MNIRDIARIANVTPGTVSKVLNNYPDISEATRQKVLAVIEENQYSPVTGSRNNPSYSTNKKLNIGLIIESVYNHLYIEMEDIISIRFHNAGYTILSFHDNYFSQDKSEKFLTFRKAENRTKVRTRKRKNGDVKLINLIFQEKSKNLQPKVSKGRCAKRAP